MEIKSVVNLAGILICLQPLLPTLAEELGDNMKYILIWDDPTLYPAPTLGSGSAAFIENKCEHRNCYTTTDRNLLNNVSHFDAIVFNGREIQTPLPTERSEKQKYVYINMESSHNYPICDNRYNDFFNWTWTYKLNSDAWWGYVNVSDLNGTRVGPKVDMHWSELGNVDNKTEMALRHKTKAAAWFVSNCYDVSKRMDFIKDTQKELNKHGLSIHIYGKCGMDTCPRSKSEECNKMIADTYFFYMAFENSFADDYVTEKVLTGLQNYAVPVVYGEADYDRFLPPGSYLDARQLGPKELASRMVTIIDNYNKGQPQLYYDFFRWRSRYIFGDLDPKEFVCKACSDLNNAELMSTRTVYPNMSQWWNSEHAKCSAHRIIHHSLLYSVFILILYYSANMYCIPI